MKTKILVSSDSGIDYMSHPHSVQALPSLIKFFEIEKYFDYIDMTSDKFFNRLRYDSKVNPKIVPMDLEFIQNDINIALESYDKVLIIDPGDNGKDIDKLVNNREIVGIIITHHHHDHDGDIDYFINKYNVKVYDRYNLSPGINKIDKFIFEVIYTPGHKEDLISIYFKNEKIMFVGDFIFRDSIGRVDLPGSSLKDMIKSIDKIKKYDRDIVIYPGHGEGTTLGYEIDNNPYFREFI